MGRVDYRRCHLAAYALECQASLHMVHGDAAYQYSQKMLAAVGALVSPSPSSSASSSSSSSSPPPPSPPPQSSASSASA